MEDKSNFYPALCPVPLMEKKRFAELTGFSEGIVEGWLDRGRIPSVLVGKHRAINLVLITQNCLAQLPLDCDND